MTELQSTDGSLFSRETDEEKSLESAEDMFSMIPDMDKEDAEKIGEWKKSSGNVKGGNEKGKRSLRMLQEKKVDHRKILNESTLLALDKHLKSRYCFNDELEYEEVSAFTSKIHRYAVERTRGRQDMLGLGIQNGNDPNVEINPIILTEEDISQERMYNQIYQKEEYYAVATKFLKSVIDGVHDTGGDDFDLHTKTANWVKRAAGMQRNYDPYEKHDSKSNQGAHSDDSDEGETEVTSEQTKKDSDRRLTRRRVKITRHKKRLEKANENFRIMSDMVLEFKNQKRSERTKKGIDHTADDDEDIEMADAIPQEIRGRENDAFPSLHNIGLEVTLNSSNYCRGEIHNNKEEPYKMDKSILPPVVARLGLEFRTKPLGLEKDCGDVSVSSQQNPTGTEVNITNKVRIKKSRQLRNILSNKRARLWAIHEFFYGDVDKEWYQKDGLVSDLAKLGFPIDAQTRLTRQEWILVRQALRPRPRLFSKRFIAEQLKKRDSHRAYIRRLQQDPSTHKFEPISPGTRITAYDKRGKTVRRGRTLLYDSTKVNYLIQFDDKDAGCEICPDYEVSVVARSKEKEHSKIKVNDEYDTELVIPNGYDISRHKSDIERELLVSFLTVVAEAFQRKKNILEVLENCADSYSEDFSGHCSYLLANLEKINTTLEAALAHTQILYGRICASPATDHKATKRQVKKFKLKTVLPKSKAFEELLSSLLSVSNKIGSIAISSHMDGNDNKNNRSSPNKLLQHEISGSTSLLLLSNYLAETSSSLASAGIESTPYSSAIDAALKVSLDRYSESCINITPTNALVSSNQLEWESRVENELKDLQMAIGMLRTEVMLATDESRTFELSNAIV